MKQLYILLFALLSSVFVNAQTFTVQEGNDLEIWGSSEDGEFKLYVNIKNNSDATERFMVARERITPLTGMETYFCVGLACYLPETDTSNFPARLDAGESMEMYIAMNSYGENGVHVEKYTIYKEDDLTDRYEVTVTVNTTPTSVSDVDVKVVSLDKIYPNPANEVINFDYQLSNISSEVKFEIYNMLGSQVMAHLFVVGGETFQVSTAELEEGYYMVRMFVDNQPIATQRFSVAR